MRTRTIAMRFKMLLHVLVALALVAGFEGRASAQGGTPSGWNPYTVEDISFALPGDWQALPKDAAALAAQVRLIARSNPELARTIQLLIDSGQLGSLGFLAASTANGDAVSVITVPLPGPVSSESLATQVGQQLAQALPGVTIIKSVGGLRVGGVDAGRVEFRLSLKLDGGATATLHAVQFYLLPPGKLHVFSVVGADNADLPALADKIGATLQVGSAPAAAPGTANTRSVANGGNLRREPRIAPSNVIGQLCAGDTVAVLGEQGAGSSRWLRVRVTAANGRCAATRVAVGAEGWASASLIGAAASPAPAGTLTARVSVSGNVRQGAGLNATVIGQIKAGETVTLLGRNAGATWYRITTPKGVTGWASATLLLVDAATRLKVPVV